MTVTLDERIATIKEIIWTVGAFAPLPEELASLHRMIKTNSPELEDAVNSFFGDNDEYDPELEDLFGLLTDESDETEYEYDPELDDMFDLLMA